MNGVGPHDCEFAGKSALTGSLVVHAVVLLHVLVHEVLALGSRCSPQVQQVTLLGVVFLQVAVLTLNSNGFRASVQVTFVRTVREPMLLEVPRGLNALLEMLWNLGNLVLVRLGNRLQERLSLWFLTNNL